MLSLFLFGHGFPGVFDSLYPTNFFFFTQNLNCVCILRTKEKQSAKNSCNYTYYVRADSEGVGYFTTFTPRSKNETQCLLSSFVIIVRFLCWSPFDYFISFRIVQFSWTKPFSETRFFFFIRKLKCCTYKGNAHKHLRLNGWRIPRCT